jgi:hypothetical protein
MQDVNPEERRLYASDAHLLQGLTASAPLPAVLRIRHINAMQVRWHVACTLAARARRISRQRNTPRIFAGCCTS